MKSSLSIADIHFSFFTALDDIINNGRRRKSVILFPHTSIKRYDRFSVLPKNWEAIKALIQEAFDNDVPVVVPAGNGDMGRSSPRRIDTVPALWGIRSNAGAVSDFYFLEVFRTLLLMHFYGRLIRVPRQAYQLETPYHRLSTKSK